MDEIIKPAKRIENLRDRDKVRLVEDIKANGHIAGKMGIHPIVAKKGTICEIMCINGNHRYFTLLTPDRNTLDVHVSKIELIEA